MRSIIDEIAQAESQADQIRLEAAAASRELMQKSRAEAEQALANLEAEERETTRLALEKAEQDGKALAESIEKELSDAADAQCETARGHLDSAVNYLMQKVQEIA